MEQVIVGAFARVEIDEAAETRQRMSLLEGVEVFDLDEPGKVGLTIEAPDLDTAHDLITGPIRNTDGVMGVWPIYVNFEDTQQREPAADAFQQI